jgi:hypothetical protein
MSRLYQEDCKDLEPWIEGRRQAGAFLSAIRGARGQRFLQDLIHALDALPEPELAAGALEDEETGCCCAFGAVRRFRGVDAIPLNFDPLQDGIEPEQLAKPFDVSHTLAWVVVQVNDYSCSSNSPDARRIRFNNVRRWALAHLYSVKP